MVLRIFEPRKDKTIRLFVIPAQHHEIKHAEIGWNYTCAENIMHSKFLTGKPEGKTQQEKLGVDENTITEIVIKQWGNRMLS